MDLELLSRKAWASPQHQGLWCKVVREIMQEEVLAVVLAFLGRLWGAEFCVSVCMNFFGVVRVSYVFWGVFFLEFHF